MSDWEDWGLAISILAILMICCTHVLYKLCGQQEAGNQLLDDPV